MIPTGLAVAIPEGHAGLVLPRSGLASRQGLTLANAPGLIDAGLPRRGDVRGREPRPASRPVDDRGGATGSRSSWSWRSPTCRAEWVHELPDSERGEGGFGSSGTRLSAG